MDWKRLLAYVTGTVDEELLLRNEYLVAERPLPRRKATEISPRFASIQARGTPWTSRSSLHDLVQSNSGLAS